MRYTNYIMQSRAFKFLIADAYRVDLKTVTVFHRMLANANLITSGSGGVNAPQMTPLDAARMTIALLATDRPARAVERVKRFGGLTFNPSKSTGSFSDSWRICDGTSLETALAGHFSGDLDMTSPYIEIQENARTASVEFSSGGAFFNDDQRDDATRNSDAKELFGIRCARGLAAAETDKFQLWFYLERRDKITWEQRFRGFDEDGNPIDPAHPWNEGKPF